MTEPRISFLVPDIAGPVLGPVTALARIVEGHYPVEIVGPDFGQGVCEMYQDAFDYSVVPTPRMYRLPNYFWESRRLEEAITGDIIFSVKAVADTLPVALRARRKRGKKVVVYLDEWDGAIMEQRQPLERWRRWCADWHHPLNEIYYPLVERLIRQADLVTSTSTFLQHKFGGRILHMGVDGQFFKPVASEATLELKEKLGLANVRLIVFGGVVRPHKGLEQVLKALVSLGDRAIRLLVVGPVTEHLRHLRGTAPFTSYLLTVGAQPKQQMPLYLSLADLIILPLADNLLARSQVPCKIFEAMAMAKPVVATEVSDLGQILDGCGWVVPPGHVSAMRETIVEVLGDEGRATRQGQAAREKCLRLYGREQTERNLLEIIESVRGD